MSREGPVDEVVTTLNSPISYLVMFYFTFIAFLTLYTKLTITIAHILTKIMLDQVTGKKNKLYRHLQINTESKYKTNTN